MVRLPPRATTAAAVLVALSALSLFAAARAPLTGPAVPTACQNSKVTAGIGAAYVAGAYQTVVVTLSGIVPQCAGRPFTVTLAGPAGALAQARGVLHPSAAGRQTVTLARPADSSRITRVGLVITD